MTSSEIFAFNAGVAAVLDLALRSSDAIGAKLVEKPTRYNFAMGALLAIAAEGQALLLPPPDGLIDPAAALLPKPPAPLVPSIAALVS